VYSYSIADLYDTPNTFKYYMPAVGTPSNEVKKYHTPLTFGASGFFIDASLNEIHMTCVQDFNALINYRASQVQVLYTNDYLPGVTDIIFDLFPLQAAPYISCR
jgi:hypothetical protein